MAISFHITEIFLYTIILYLSVPLGLKQTWTLPTLCKYCPIYNFSIVYTNILSSQLYVRDSVTRAPSLFSLRKLKRKVGFHHEAWRKVYGIHFYTFIMKKTHIMKEKVPNHFLKLQKIVQRITWENTPNNINFG